MKRIYLWAPLMVIVVVVALVFVVALLKIPSQKSFDHYSLPEDYVTLDQNWSADIRQQVHYTHYGSKIMPYALFANMEQGESHELLSDDALMERLGFIVQDASKINPAGLPIGFALDNERDGAWVGLTCTACHTSLLRYQGHSIVIEGGPGMLDFNQFESEILSSLTATLDDRGKFDRLITRLELEEKPEIDALRTSIEDRKRFFERRAITNAVTVSYGHGRLDAFGRIFNAVTSAALHQPTNFHVPDAPVSIPMLWDASHFDLVQWNGSAPNKGLGPVGQNVTTALAVYGEIDMLGDATGYPSSVNVANLGYIQRELYKLMSPKWPEALMGALDQARVAQGAQIYKERCIECHSVILDRDKKRKIKVKMIETHVVGTDPVMANNFSTFTSKTGPLEGKKVAIIGGRQFEEEEKTLSVVLNATLGAMIHQPIDLLSAFIAGNAEVYETEPDKSKQAYKARPLNGVWATAPFLHNGSVPTLFDLLSPVAERPAEFYVGSRAFDIEQVGFEYDYSENASFFDTRLKGNRNTGHEYAADLSEEDRWALIEYVKSL
ncbi:MAG: hypothetical protein K6L81_05950 [Agarilytica sp.]